MGERTEPAFQEWVDTANYLASHSASTVACPCCGGTSLSVRDVEYGFGHDRGVQRYISCGCCGAFTSVNVKCAGETEGKAFKAAE